MKINERKRLQKEILEISGREQQRIGQDLHDDLCQQLTAVTLLTEVLEKKLSDKALPESADAGEIHKLIARAIVQTRLLARGLLPLEIEPDGLAAALETMASNTEKMTRISCRVVCAGAVLIRSRPIALHLYRIAQEAITNAVKHARARHIVITLLARGGRIFLSITDDGAGISKARRPGGGLGLSIMNSRADMINAALQIRKSGKSGTAVTCSLRAPRPPVREGRHGRA